MVHVFPASLTLLSTTREALDITREFLQRNLDTFDHRTAILPPPAWRKEMTRILFVGQKPETVDFSDPSLPPGFNAEKINAGHRRRSRKNRGTRLARRHLHDHARCSRQRHA